MNSEEEKRRRHIFKIVDMLYDLDGTYDECPPEKADHQVREEITVFLFLDETNVDLKEEALPAMFGRICELLPGVMENLYRMANGGVPQNMTYGLSKNRKQLIFVEEDHTCIVVGGRWDEEGDPDNRKIVIRVIYENTRIHTLKFTESDATITLKVGTWSGQA